MGTQGNHGAPVQVLTLLLGKVYEAGELVGHILDQSDWQAGIEGDGAIQTDGEGE